MLRVVTTTGIALVLVFGGLSALVQTVTGFGGALVLAPVLFGTMRPGQAVLVAALVGFVQSGTLAVRERRHVLHGEAARLLAASLPGVAVGVVVLRVAPSSVLQVVVGVSVIVATALRRLFRPARELSVRAALPAGFLSGVLSISATVSGPPLVLYLAGRKAPAAAMRGTLAAIFIGLDLLTFAALVAGGVLLRPPLAALVALMITFPLGLYAGVRLGTRLRDHHYDLAVTVLLLALGVSSIVAGLG
jgi:uncharacterized membrane protein YfcA